MHTYLQNKFLNTSVITFFGITQTILLIGGKACLEETSIRLHYRKISRKTLIQKTRETKKLIWRNSPLQR